MIVNKKYLIFGQKLKAVRKKYNLTQEALCEKIGCTSFTIKRWEKGTSYPLSVYHPILFQILPEMAKK